MTASQEQARLDAATSLVRGLADKLDLNASVRLWDGSRIPLGRNVTGPFELSIASAGVIGSILRSPKLDTIIRHYVDKGIDYSGGSLIDFGVALNREGRPSTRIKLAEALKLAYKLKPFLFAKPEDARDEQGFGGDIIGRVETRRDNTAYISFHYDLSNEFYALFLDPEMVYTCAYFTDWGNTLEQAQFDKLEMVCRKLRLKPGERFLDIGSGWGALVCHAAKHHGVKAHGITLSKEQLAYAQEKVNRLGLQDRVTFQFIDYANLTGTFDKIASVGMYEAIGLENNARYMRKVRSLLSEDGLFLNHAISRRAKRPGRWMPEKVRPEQRALAKYIFPGGALDDVGNTVAEMERAGMEVLDVEGWRKHYELTTRLWHDRLVARRDEAIKLVGEDKYRIYVAYLAGCSIVFNRGSARLFQVLASKSVKRAPAVPNTRADLYR
ncbi:MAG: cyclopropane-fatty-acyl-phospholipid synthase family protein [Hyphomicrobiaceae bacterium]|nr:cyclopropane-fatty-acyl-phospholipid synthase family protein [Hyphomicrobiaceae bacterium]